MPDKTDKKLKTYEKELSRRGFSKETINSLIQLAKAYYAEYMKDDIPSGEMMHAEGIYLKAAMYKALLPVLGPEASFDLIANVLYETCAKLGKWCDRFTRIPGLKYLFIKMFKLMTDKMFGEAGDFRKEILISDKREFRFNMTQCPYVKYFKRAGFPELCKMSCIADEYSYGHMKNITFERTQTLGTGGVCCDFCFKVK